MSRPPADAFLLAAGFGTRLRPLTLDRPKPLVPLCGLPLLDQAVARLQDQGFERAVVNAHHLPEAIEAWAERQDFDLVVSLESPRILGTGGGLRHAREHLADRFVVVNGDVLSDVDLRALIEAVPGGPGAAAMALRRGGPQYGIVAADATDTVVDLVGLAVAEPVGAVDRTTHFTGIHALDQGALERVPEGEACVVRTAYGDLVPRRRVRALRHAGTWVDLGNPQLYLAANRAALAGELPLVLDPMPRAAFARRGDRTWGSRDAVEASTSARIEGPCWIGPSVVLEADVVVGPGAILGAGAVVRRGARVRDSVVWDSAVVTAEARLEHTVVHDSGVHTVETHSGAQ